MIGAPGIDWRWRRAVFYDGVAGEGSAGSGGGTGGGGGSSDGNSSDGAQATGGKDEGDRARDAASAAAPGAGPFSAATESAPAPASAVVPFQSVTPGRPKPNDDLMQDDDLTAKVARAFVSIVTAPIAGAGLLMGLVDRARAMGLAETPATPPDQFGNSFAPVGGPYRTDILAPASPPAVPGQPDPDFPFLQGAAITGPYSTSLGSVQPSPGALQAISSVLDAQPAPDGAGSAENASGGLLGPLAAAAVVAAAVAYG